MRERKVWSQHEDNVLRYLKEEKGEKKWSVIARKMEEQFQIEGRTGKQCRERYHNHLDSAIVTSEWTQEEDQLLYILHEENGNKWSSISQKLPGRSDNCVKNHFYSKLRKSVRRLNKFIADHLSREYELISPRLLSKIIETSEFRFKSSTRLDEETIQFSITLKNRLYRFQSQCGQIIESEEEIATARQIIEDIFFFQKNKKKPGKLIRRRTNSFDQKDIFLHPKACLKFGRSNSNISDSSDISQDFSCGFSSSFCSSNQEDIEQVKPRKRSMTTRSSKDLFSRNGSQIIEEKKQVQSNSSAGKGKKESEAMMDFQIGGFLGDKLSTSLIEEHQINYNQKKERKASISSNQSYKSSSNKSNHSGPFQTFQDFCQLDQKIGFSWPNYDNPDVINEGNQIMWRVIEPRAVPIKLSLVQDDDPIIPCGEMQEQF